MSRRQKGYSNLLYNSIHFVVYVYTYVYIHLCVYVYTYRYTLCLSLSMEFESKLERRTTLSSVVVSYHL